MPELPDLTVFAENLQRLLQGKKIAGISGSGSAAIPPGEVASAVIRRVERAGKEVAFLLDNGNRLQVHLMLTGGFVFQETRGGVGSAVLALEFADGSRLLVEDPKGWAKISLNPAVDPATVDALEITPENLRELIRRKPRAQAKAFLVDQQVIRGIGNAYADEILWEARIAPQAVMGKLPPAAVAALAAAIPAVLLGATEEIRGKHPHIISGEIRHFLKVHNPSKKFSPDGKLIRKETVAGKTTYFTDDQIPYGRQ